MDFSGFAKMLLNAILFILSVLPSAIPPDVPVCVVLGVAERSCPTKQESLGGQTTFPSGASTCYYYDLGSPTAGTIKNFPGWQKSNCYDDIFKDRACVPEGNKIIPSRCDELKIPRY